MSKKTRPQDEDAAAEAAPTQNDTADAAAEQDCKFG